MYDIIYKRDGSVIIKTELRSSSYAIIMLAMTQYYLTDLYYFIFSSVGNRLYNKTMYSKPTDRIDDNQYINKFDTYIYNPENYMYTDKKTRQTEYLKLSYITSTAKHKITHFAIEDSKRFGILYIKWCKSSGYKYTNPKHTKKFIENLIENNYGLSYHPKLGYIPQSIDYSVVNKFKYGKKNPITGNYDNLGHYLIPKLKEDAYIISESDKLLIQRYLLSGYHIKHFNLYTMWCSELYLSMHLTPTESSGVFQHLEFIRKDS